MPISAMLDQSLIIGSAGYPEVKADCQYFTDIAKPNNISILRFSERTDRSRFRELAKLSLPVVTVTENDIIVDGYTSLKTAQETGSNVYIRFIPPMNMKSAAELTLKLNRGLKASNILHYIEYYASYAGTHDQRSYIVLRDYVKRLMNMTASSVLIAAIICQRFLYKPEWIKKGKFRLPEKFDTPEFQANLDRELILLRMYIDKAKREKLSVFMQDIHRYILLALNTDNGIAYQKAGVDLAILEKTIDRLASLPYKRFEFSQHVAMSYCSPAEYEKAKKQIDRIYNKLSKLPTDQNIAVVIDQNINIDKKQRA